MMFDPSTFDPSTFDPASLPQETRDGIMRCYLSSLRKLYGKKDPFTIWHREMEYCDSLLKKMEKGKAQDEEYIKSRVVLYEIERMMGEKGIPLPKRKRTLTELVDAAAAASAPAAAPIVSTSTSSTVSSPTGKPVDEAGEKVVENEHSESVDEAGLVAWLDSFDPSTLTLEERVEISGGMAEDVEKQYAHHREMLRKALARNLSTETCRRNLSHALQFKIQVSLVQLRERFNPITFSERLKAVRESAGDTVDQMAAKLGRSVEEVTLWESGAITNDDLIKICNFYGVRVEELIGA